MEEIIRTGFKVCRNIGNYNMFESAYKFGKAVKYVIDIWTYRPVNCGSLAVFNTLKNAKHFLNTEKDGFLEIFLCEYVESMDGRLYKPDKIFDKIWTPKGTLYADKVKIIKKINNI